MTLLSLLIAMALERVLLPSPKWQFSTYLQPVLLWLQQREFTQAWFQNIWGALLLAMIPTLICALVLHWVDGLLFGLLSLVVNVTLILLAMGCFEARRSYKQFLRAACRKDEEACYLVASRFSSVADNDEAKTAEQNHQLLEQGLGQALIWVNYRFYLAVMIWLMLFGVVGVVFYASLRTLVDCMSPHETESGNNESDTPTITTSEDANRLLTWADILPVRIASLGLTLVGNFGKAMPVWLESLLNVAESPKTHLIRVSLAAEEIDDPANPTCVASVTKFVEVAKRNVILMLSLIAVLTLYGSLA